VHGKARAKCGLSVHHKVRVQGDNKCDIRANLNQRFNDRDCFPLECPIRLYGDEKTGIHIAENAICFIREPDSLRLIVI